MGDALYRAQETFGAEALSSDGVHPTLRGSAVIAREWLSRVREAGWL
jgi:lysophospholipase L1-like esterase